MPRPVAIVGVRPCAAGAAFIDERPGVRARVTVEGTERDEGEGAAGRSQGIT
jgi:hypothetical protein